MFDKFYEENGEKPKILPKSDRDKIMEILRIEGGKSVKELWEVKDYKSRSSFLKEVINLLIEEGLIYRDRNIKSPKAVMRVR